MIGVREVVVSSKDYLKERIISSVIGFGLTIDDINYTSICKNISEDYSEEVVESVIDELVTNYPELWV